MPNILAFNVGVELGQLLALSGILIVMGFWRRSNAFTRQAFTANTVLMTAWLHADRVSAHRLFRFVIEVDMGTFTAPLAGKHGWYWKNRGSEPVTVEVEVVGFQEKLFRPGH